MFLSIVAAYDGLDSQSSRHSFLERDRTFNRGLTCMVRQLIMIQAQHVEVFVRNDAFKEL